VTRAAWRDVRPRREGTIVTVDFPQTPFGACCEAASRSCGAPRRELSARRVRDVRPFQDHGITEYIAFSVRVGETIRYGETEGMVASWTTDAAGGFTTPRSSS
jgi:hypothetical protein